MKASYEIPAIKLGSFYATIEKANKKANKLGLQPITTTTVKKELKSVVVTDIIEGKEYQTKKTMEVLTIEVEGNTPKIEGYSLIGMAEFVGLPKPILTAFSEHDNEQLTKVVDCHCDHCNTNRQRNSVFLIKNTIDKSLMQVGKSCLKDFFPKDVFGQVSDFTSIINVFNEIDQLMDAPNYGNPKHIFIPVELIVAYAIMCINVAGYVSTNNASEGNVPTSHIIKGVIAGDIKMTITDEDVNKAKQLLSDNKELLDNHFENNNTVFNYNVKNFLETGYVTTNNIGYIAYLPVLIAKLVSESTKKESSYLGNVKDKLTVSCTLVKHTGFETMYGYTNLYIFEDDNGNVLSWFNTGKTIDADLNTKVTLTGTVKQHNLYNGVKQTVLTRCKVK
jgi:hypothetical protein